MSCQNHCTHILIQVFFLVFVKGIPQLYKNSLFKESHDFAITHFRVVGKVLGRYSTQRESFITIPGDKIYQSSYLLTISEQNSKLSGNVAILLQKVFYTQQPGGEIYSDRIMIFVTFYVPLRYCIESYLELIYNIMLLLNGSSLVFNSKIFN